MPRVVATVICSTLLGWLLTPAWAGDAPAYRLLDGTEPPLRSATDGLRTCFDFKDLRVTADNDIGVGDSIYITPPSTTECKAGVALGGVAIDSDDSNFIGKFARFLIIDQGTGPEPRGLVLLDFAARKSVYDDLYDNPLEVKGGVLRYWRPTEIKATKENCPKYDEWVAEGLPPIIERQVEVDLRLSTPTRIESKKLRCRPTQ